METIVTEIIKTIKDSDTVIERDMELLALFFELFRTALGMALEQLDRELATEYKKQGYVVGKRLIIRCKEQSKRPCRPKPAGPLAYLHIFCTSSDQGITCCSSSGWILKSILGSFSNR